MTSSVWFQTDNAWDFLPADRKPDLPVVDVREEAKGLRFITTARRIDRFAERHAKEFRPFTLFGSGDFHHLSGVWMRQFEEPFVVLSFDNHPDWDVRPPYWSCGAWINRALESPRAWEVSIWGCGNFECHFPGRLLGNRSAAKAGWLQVHPWAQQGVHYPAWLHPITPETWRAQFTEWVRAHGGQNIYVTVDIDCLVAGQALTNWENGRFTCDDLVWALGLLREKAKIIGGDLCGAWSRPEYSGSFRRLAAWFDHPRLPEPTPQERLARNLRVLETVWPALAR